MGFNSGFKGLNGTESRMVPVIVIAVFLGEMDV